MRQRTEAKREFKYTGANERRANETWLKLIKVDKKGRKNQEQDSKDNS